MYAQQIHWLKSSFNFSFDNVSECCASNTFCSACKTSELEAVKTTDVAGRMRIFAADLCPRICCRFSDIDHGHHRKVKVTKVD